MSEANTNPPAVPGIFCWNELITSDVAGAKKFYGDLFGWEADTQSIQPGWDYTIFKKNGATVGGMFGITPEMGPIPTHWLSYVMSENIAADVAKAKAVGGTILKEEMEVPNVGAFAIIQDPQGAVFALWKCTKSCGCGCDCEG